MTRSIAITFFPNQSAQSMRVKSMTLAELRDLIQTTTASSKQLLPWLKLALFGKQRSDRNCLRHNANVEVITGVELDYDAKEMPLDKAIAIAKKAHLTALFYTSANYTDAAPKWRIILPTSKQRALELRATLAARVNGLYGGVFAPESFVLSQAFYFGSINNNPAHRAELIHGDYIDRRSDLDAGAIGKSRSSIKPRKGNANLIADDINLLAAAVAEIPNDLDGWVPWKNFGMAVWGATGGSADGFAIFDEFSRRWECSAYDEAMTRQCWQEICGSPPSSIGAGTIFHMANLASPGWRAAYEIKFWQKLAAQMMAARSA